MSDDTPLSPSDTIFALAYASAIKTKFQVDVGEHFCIQTSPVTQRGMAAGDLIYPQMTNFLIYKFADALQYSNTPTYTGGSAGSYLQQLRRYIDWVKTSSNPSQVVVDRMAKTRTAADGANTNYFAVLGQAQTQFNSVKDLTRASAQTELYQAMQLYFGPDAPALSGYIDGITNALGSNALPGYNQDGLVDDQDLIASVTEYANTGQKPPEQSIAQSTIRVPAYTIATYNSGVQAWITAAGHGATRDQVITIDIDQGRNTTWEDYGFHQVTGGGGVGFWPFFYAEVYVNNQWEKRTLKTEGRENSISMQLSMIGVQRFNIDAGQRDVANIRALFPNRLPNAPDVLSSEYARIVSVLVGYDVALKLEFASDIKSEVNDIYNEVKTTGGRFSLFGFYVSAGAGGGSTDRVETKFDDVQWDSETGSMSLAPTAGQVYPTILATVSQRFESS